ncbi:hypothetical protein D3C86_1544420 [compost metagenome]
MMRNDPKKYKERYDNQKPKIQKTDSNNKTDSTNQKVDTIGEKVIRNEEREKNEK